MYTTAGEKDARRTLEYFEQVRDFFMRVKSQNVTTRLPVTIVAFKNQKEYKPYAPRETTSAYYTGDEQRDYIVLGNVGTDHFPIAVHEYMHLLIRHSGLKIPSWLNEGIAETYSTIKPLGGQILMGTPPQGRGVALSQMKWIPLERLLSLTQQASEFDEKDRTSVFYSQSWLLTHMLMLSQPYASGFPKFVDELSKGAVVEQALQKTYGKTVADLGRDLQAYYRGSLNGVLFDVKLQKIVISDPKAATVLETGLALAKLTALLRRKDEARTRYSELAKSFPENVEIYEALAHLYWQEGDISLAKENFRRAIGLNPPHWKTYWDYARLAQGEEGSVEALRSALRLNPQLAEARLMLGYELYRAHKYQEAYDAFAEIRHVTPERAPQFFLMKAFSAMEIGKQAEARGAAASAKQYAKTAADVTQADRLLEYLDRKPEPTTIRPATARIAKLSPSMTPPSELAVSDQERGILEEIECLGQEAKVKILAGDKRLVLLIRDPASVQLRNSDETSVSLACGKQPAGTRVNVGFRPTVDAKLRTSGEVVTLEFLK